MFDNCTDATHKRQPGASYVLGTLGYFWQTNPLTRQLS